MKRVFATCLAFCAGTIGAAHAQDYNADLLKEAAATNGGEIVLESILSNDTIKAFAQAFNDEFSKDGVHVKLVRYQSSQLVQLYDQELRAGKVSADLMLLGDPSIFIDLAKKNDLTLYCSPNFKDFRPEALSPDCSYFNATAHFQYMLYNTDLMGNDGPTSWADLVDPKYKGKTSILDPQQGGGSYFFTYTMNKLFGLDFYRKAKENEVLLAQSHNVTENQVMSGERYFAISISDLVRQDGPYPGGKGAPIKEVFPKEGATLITAGMGITKGGPNLPGAKFFIDWTASLEGQKALSQHGLFSLRKDFTDVEGDDLSKISYHWWDINEMNAARDDLIKQAEDILSGR